MSSRLKLLILFVFATTTISCKSQKKKICWDKDIEFIKNKLPEKHINLFFTKSKSEFSRGLDNIKKKINELSDIEIALKLQQLMVNMGDSHTGLDWRQLIDKEKILPIKNYWFTDGIYITHAKSENKKILGAKILGINKHPVGEIIESLKTLIVAENNGVTKKSIPYLIRYAQVLDFFGFSNNGKYLFLLESLNGEVFSYEIVPEDIKNREYLSLEINPRPYYLEDTKIAFRQKYYVEDSILYAQYNRCTNKKKIFFSGQWDKFKSTPSFSGFKSTILKAINEGKVKKLIFDMQFNTGGFSGQGTKFVKQLSKTKINKKGSLFVIIGRNTFSSAIINTYDFITYTEAILIGEETAGKLNHYGEVKKMKLPTSGLLLYYSTDFFQLDAKQSEQNTINPDILIERSFNNYLNGIDPVYEYVKQEE